MIDEKRNDHFNLRVDELYNILSKSNTDKQGKIKELLDSIIIKLKEIIEKKSAK